MFDTIVEMAKREVKGTASPDEILYLKEHVGLTRWREALAAAIADISEQFADRKDRMDGLAKKFQLGLISKDQFHRQSDEIEEWRRKAGRYKIGLENRMHEINGLERERNVRATEIKWRFEELVRAVETHRSRKQRPSAGDRELWEAAERLATK